MAKFSKKSKILAIIPARGGSIGIKNKNLAKIGNTTLLEKAIHVCKKINFIDDIIISTDSRSISKIAEKNNLPVPFLRSKKNSNSTANINDAILETIKKSENHFKKKYDVIILVEPTSPLRKVSDLINAFEKFFKYNFDNLWTISEINLDFHPDKQLKIKSKKLIYYNNNGKKIKRRQDLGITYKRNGVCYIINKNVFLKTNKMLNNNTGYLILKDKHISIDTIEDLLNVRKIFKNKKKK